MKLSWTVTATAALAGFAAAQTPSGVTPAVSQNLMVTFAGTNVVSPPGERIPRGDTANPPSFFLPVRTSVTTACLLMVDFDVPRNGSRVKLLHWLANGTMLAPSSNGTMVTPPANGGGAAPYRQPSPPQGDVPHRYVFMLFEQPSGFSIPSDFTDVLQTRVPFDLAGFISEAQLTNALGANYITVQNTTGPFTTTFPPASPGSPFTSTPAAGSNATASGAATSVVLSTQTAGGATGSAAATASGAAGAGSTAAGGATASATGGAATTSSAPSVVASAAGNSLDAPGTLGKMAGAAMGVLGFFSYLLL